MDKYWHWLKSWNWDIDDEYAWIILIIKGFAWVCFAILGLELACVYYLFAFFINIIMGNYKWQNLPNGICKIGFILTLMLLVLFYTGSWIKNSYNQCWAVVLTISYILTFVGFYYYAKQKNYVKQKDTLFNKVCEITTITGIASIIGAFPMMILGYLISAIFFGNDNPRMVQALCYGWSITSVVLCLSQIPKMIDFNAIRVNYLYSKGDKLYDKGKYKEAIEVYNKAKGLDTSNSPYYFYAMGLAYLGLNDYTQALYKFERAIKINDSYPEFYYAIADTCLESNDYETGLDYIDKLLNKLDKDSKNYKECEQFKADYIKRKEKLDHECNSDKARELYEQATRYKNFSEYGKANNCIKQALELTPDNESCEILFKLIQTLYKEEVAKIDKLYDEAVEHKNIGDYHMSLDVIRLGISLSNKQDISTDNFEKLQKEVKALLDKLKQAEEKYNTAMTLYKNKEFSNAVFNMERAISLAPKNDLYQNKLVEIQKEWDKQKTRAEELFFEAKSHLQNNDFSKALSSINSALNMIIDNRYTELKSDIERQQKQVQNKKDSEKLYKEAEKLYNSNHINYERIIELLESANKKYPKTKYQDFLKSIKTERNTIQAEKLYEKAKKDFENKNYEPAISSINEAIKLIPSNNMYIDLKQKITWEQRKYESDQYAEKSYKTGVKAYNDGDFTNAVDNLTKACNIKPDNEEWQKVLEKAKTGKIDIMYCSKKGLLSLGFIENEKVEQILKSRYEGSMWYDYRDFCEAFEFNEPHQLMGSEEKILFPLKQGNKYGRRLDW